MLAALWVMLAVPVATPVTVNVWALFQFVVVKVRADGFTVATAVAPLVALTVTRLAGWLSSWTV